MTAGLRRLEFGSGSRINVPIALLIWLMIYPMMLRIDFASKRPRFELAVATAIALYGPASGAALATVVGVLVEVPVMLSVCRFQQETA